MKSIAQEPNLRKLLSDIILRSALSREEIAERMSALLNCRVTVYMLNDFTCERHFKGSRFPAEWVKAFSLVLGSDRLQRSLLSPRLLKLVEWAEMHLDVAVSLKKIELARQKLLNDLGD